MSSSGTQVQFGVVMPVGPGEKEIARLRDTIESLETYEPGRFHLVLVDDSAAARDLKRDLGLSLSGRLTVIPNPRHGRGQGWEAGCTTAVLAGFAQLTGVPLAFVLKLDTDALVARPFADRIVAEFAQHPSVGMLGTRFFADGGELNREWVRKVGVVLEKLARPFALWRKTSVRNFPALQVALWGDYKMIRDTIRTAFINGYRVGDHCQGGAYAVSAACLQAFAQHGCLGKPCLWLRTPIPEDHTISLCVKAVGLSLRDFSGDGELFSSHWQGLMDTPENLLKRGYAFIHSVKDHGGRTEEQNRAGFRAARTGCAAPAH
jgi:hypothetical protein